MTARAWAHLTRVREAWRTPGPVPAAHRKAQARLRRDWPTLAHALDALPEPPTLPDSGATGPDVVALPDATRAQAALAASALRARMGERHRRAELLRTAAARCPDPDVAAAHRAAADRCDAQARDAATLANRIDTAAAQEPPR